MPGKADVRSYGSVFNDVAEDYDRHRPSVQLVNARLEDAVLPRAHYSAVFSASAIHWIDPDVSWRKAADALVDGGSVALVSYCGLDDSRSADDQQALSGP